MSTLKQLTKSYSQQIASAVNKTPPGSQAESNAELKAASKCTPRGKAYLKLCDLESKSIA